ncbi:MAG: porin [Alphaproteobacteria bacterium]
MIKRAVALLATVAAAALPSQAGAEGLDVDLRGYIRSYAIYADNDETGGTTASNDLRQFDFRREIEIHFKGETELKNGLTVGLQAEFELGSEADDGSVPTGKDPNQFDEAFLYFKGKFGKLHFGSKDGAAYMLQVAAPAADTNIDGMRVYMQGLNPDVWDDGVINASFAPAGFALRLGYDNADFRGVDKIAYFTPEFMGFRAGASYAPEDGQNQVDDAFNGMNLNDRPGKFENIWDAGIRWDGDLGPVGLQAGAGVVHATPEVNAAVGASGSDDLTSWNAGLALDYQDFSLGAAYRHSDTGVSGPDTDRQTYFVGAGWDHGPWHAGASWYRQNFDSNANSFGFVDDISLQRITVGGGYILAPGVSFRSTVSFGSVDTGVAANDTDFTQITFGNEIKF